MSGHNSGSLSPLQTVQNRKRQLQIHRNYAALCLKLCTVALGIWLVFSQVFLVYRNQSVGMFPSVREGDLVLANRLHRSYGKEDVVVYRWEGTLHLGRIAAAGTDMVMLDGNGSLPVNGNPGNEKIRYPGHAKEHSAYSLGVQIPPENIQGKVIALIRCRGL